MPYKDKAKTAEAMQNYRAKLTLFNIQNGNVCSLCEKQLNWLHYPKDIMKLPDTPIAIHNQRAICMECYLNLKEKYQ